MDDINFHVNSLLIANVLLTTITTILKLGDEIKFFYYSMTQIEILE